MKLTSPQSTSSGLSSCLDEADVTTVDIWIELEQTLSPADHVGHVGALCLMQYIDEMTLLGAPADLWGHLRAEPE
ncbi:hypothetical protein ACOMHN_054743 [Nucella lapillus]